MPKHVFIGMVEVAGYYEELTQGFERLGVPVTFYGGHRHEFGYSCRKYPIPLRCLAWIENRKYQKRAKGRIHKKLVDIAYKATKILCLVWSLFKFDVYIFGFATSFSSRNLDLAVLKFFGKTVIANVGHGSEARHPCFNGANQVHMGVFNAPTWLLRETDKKRKKIAYIERYADFVICSPASGHLLKSDYINYFKLGVPTTTPQINTQTNPEGDFVITHAPSKRLTKGSVHIKSVVTQLINAGYSIEFRELHGLKNAEVLASIATSDLVIDQLYTDSLATGIIKEASSLGVPSITAGYHLQTLSGFFAEGVELPFHCEPEALYASLEKLLQSKQELFEKGQRLQGFYRDSWSAEKVAENYVSLFEGSYPEHWLFKASHKPKIFTWGVSKSLMAESLADYEGYMQSYPMEQEVSLKSWKKLAMESFGYESCL